MWNSECHVSFRDFETISLSVSFRQKGKIKELNISKIRAMQCFYLYILGAL